MLIIYNPAAGRRRAQLLWRVLDVMSSSGAKLELVETHHAGHATDLARDAASRGVQLIVAAGGDGTIADVANGLIGSDSRLGIIPLGTANVLAHELGLPFAPAAVAATLAFGRTQPLWPGVAQSTGVARSEGRRRVFVQMVGAGFDAQVVHRLSLGLKRAVGRGAYVAQSLRELTRYKFAPIKLRIDGSCVEAGSVVVAKGRFYAGCYTLAPDATPTAPGFTVALFTAGGPWAAMMYGAALPLDLIARMPGLRLVRARHVEIESVDVPTQADGDPAGRAPLTVTDAEGPIRVVVP